MDGLTDTCDTVHLGQNHSLAAASSSHREQWRVNTYYPDIVTQK